VAATCATGTNLGGCSQHLPKPGSWCLKTSRTPGKTKRSGRGVVKTSGLKKAIVTLTKDSKKFEVVENV
jgi:hypothetical protein